MDKTESKLINSQDVRFGTFNKKYEGKTKKKDAKLMRFQRKCKNTGNTSNVKFKRINGRIKIHWLL